jgi:hypothetical protein
MANTSANPLCFGSHWHSLTLLSSFHVASPDFAARFIDILSIFLDAIAYSEYSEYSDIPGISSRPSA